MFGLCEEFAYLAETCIVLTDNAERGFQPRSPHRTVPMNTGLPKRPEPLCSVPNLRLGPSTAAHPVGSKRALDRNARLKAEFHSSLFAVDLVQS